MSRTVTITFLLREQSLTITKAEYNLLLKHPDLCVVVAFLQQQYMLRPDAALAVVTAVKAQNVTTFFDNKVEVRYKGEEATQEITYAEYNMLPSLTTVQATKFIRDQYQLALYEAKRCADAARAQHKEYGNL